MNNKKLYDIESISIITCTFNRGELLKNLYSSLKRQTCKDFKWVIIDDGSSDNTCSIVEEFIKENKLNIEYKYKNNGGKHRALNYAIDICSTNMFFIVDSDDILTDNAIQEIINMDKLIEKKDGFCGFAGLRATFNNKILTSEFSDEYFDASSVEATYKYNLFGDKAEVFYTNILKKYRFPEFEGEKFLTENVLWHKIGNDGYKMRWFNKIIYLCEYRDDGLTKNGFKNTVINCKGESFYHNQESSFNIPLKYKIKHQANYYRYGVLAKKSIVDLIKKSSKKNICLISLPLGMIGVFYTKIKLKTLN